MIQLFLISKPPGIFVLLVCFFCVPFVVTMKSNAVLVIDPFIDFIHEIVKNECKKRNLEVIEVVSGYTDAIMTSAGDSTYRNVIPSGMDLDMIRQWCAIVAPDSEILCVLSESDVGTTAQERIQVALSLVGNGISPHLRSKFEVNELLKSSGSGLKTTKQLLTKSWNEETRSFVDQLLTTSSVSTSTSPCVVVKPTRGVASDGVYLCPSKEIAKTAFDKLIGTIVS